VSFSLRKVNSVQYKALPMNLGYFHLSPHWLSRLTELWCDSSVFGNFHAKTFVALLTILMIFVSLVSLSWLRSPPSKPLNLTTHLHLVPRSKNAWSYTSTPQYASMMSCSVKEKSAGTLPLSFTFTVTHDYSFDVFEIPSIIWHKIQSFSQAID
jgi:hypothetical protein